MKKTNQNSQSLSSSAETKRSLPVPTVLFSLLHVILLLCSKFAFSSWTSMYWLIFIPLYMILWIASVLYVIHWHRKKNLEEKTKLEKIKAARKNRIAELDKQADESQLERDKLCAQKDSLKMLLQNSRISKITCEHHPILGDNVHIEFEGTEKATHHSKYTG